MAAAAGSLSHLKTDQGRYGVRMTKCKRKRESERARVREEKEAERQLSRFQNYEGARARKLAWGSPERFVEGSQVDRVGQREMQP